MRAGIGIVCAGLAVFTVGCSSRADTPVNNRRPAPPVTVAEVTREDVPIEVRAIGNTEAFQTVSIRARVAGQITKVYFKQGTDVNQGDPLFLIDPRPYEDTVRQMKALLAKDTAAVQQAEAATARDRSLAQNARVEAARYADLFKQGISSHEQTDQFETAAKSAEAAVRADEASIAVARELVQVDESNLAAAELQLSFTKISAPISGRAGDLNIHEGSMVKDQDSAPLVVINQISPLYVTFSVPEAVLTDIHKYMPAGKLIVTASPPQTQAAPESGVLDFVNNTVDTSTGMIQLKGLFSNTERRMWPGQFVNATLHLTTDRGAVVVPSAAIQNGQQGQYVFVVGSNLVAQQRPVATGSVYGDKTVIVSGLAPGERVVTDGQLGVTPGAHVAIVNPSAGARQAGSR